MVSNTYRYEEMKAAPGLGERTPQRTELQCGDYAMQPLRDPEIESAFETMTHVGEVGYTLHGLVACRADVFSSLADR